MANTDFFDDDLVKGSHAIRNRKVKDAEGIEDDLEIKTAGMGEPPVKPVSDLNLSKMARRKEQMDTQVARAMEELELLKSRQVGLEREKRELEDLRRKQDEYIRGKREMTEGLNESIIRLENEEVKAEELTEMLGTARRRFRNMITEIDAIRESNWEEDKYNEELHIALTKIDNIRVEFNKALAKIENVTRDEKKSLKSNISPALAKSSGLSLGAVSFGDAFRLGLAFFLPAILAATVIVVVYHLVSTGAL